MGVGKRILHDEDHPGSSLGQDWQMQNMFRCSSGKE
jgi:hypothetical protein